MPMFKRVTKKPIKNKSKLRADGVSPTAVKDFRKGDFIRINGKSPIYIRGEYDREQKKYHLINVRDVYGSGRFVKGNTRADSDFEY